MFTFRDYSESRNFFYQAPHRCCVVYMQWEHKLKKANCTYAGVLLLANISHKSSEGFFNFLVYRLHLGIGTRQEKFFLIFSFIKIVFASFSGNMGHQKITFKSPLSVFISNLKLVSSYSSLNPTAMGKECISNQAVNLSLSI